MKAFVAGGFAERLTRIADKVGQVIRVVRLTPFDTSTEEGRSKERLRRVALTALASIFAKVITISTMLISIPLTLHYLGAERYGMWMVISSFAVFLSFSDLGFGNGVLNAIARLNGQNDSSGIRAVITNGYFALFLVGAGLLAMFFVVRHFVPWAALFNVSSPLAVAEAGPAMTAYALFFCIGIPFILIQRIQLGLQQGFNSSLWQCFSSLLGLTGVLVVIQVEGGLPMLVAGLVGAPLAANALNALVFFWQRPDLMPSPRFLSNRHMRQIGHAGLLFFVLQVVTAVAYGSDNIVIAQILGSAAVPEYAVPERMFSLVSMLIAMALAPLWPAYGEAIAREDYAWVRQTLIRSLTIGVSIAAFGSVILNLFGVKILGLWVGHAVVPSLSLFVGLGVWKVLEVLGISLSVFFNGAHMIKVQLFAATATAVSAIGLKILLIGKIGVAGAVWATIVSFIFFTMIPLTFKLRPFFRTYGAR